MSQESTFKSTFTMVLVMLVVVAVVFFGTANLLSDNTEETLDEALLTAIDQRIAPVGSIEIGEAGALLPENLTGVKIFEMVCGDCHETGAQKSPKMGDNAAWAKRLANGYDSLLKTSIEGKGKMPARGGEDALTDMDLRKAINYMLENSGLKGDPLPVVPEEGEGEAAAEEQAAEAGGEAAPAEAASAAPPSDTSDDTTAANSAAAAHSGGFDLEAGRLVYIKACFACHGTGASNSPKLSDASIWKDRLAQGQDVLIRNALQGYQGKYGYMPPKGGHNYLSEEEVRNAVGYILAFHRQ